MPLFLRFLSTLLFLSALFWGAAEVSAAAAPPDEAEYWQLVRESRAALDALMQPEPGTETFLDAQSLRRLEALAARWEDIQQVRLEDGRMLRVDGSFWAASLRANPPDLPRLRELFLALERERQFEAAQGLPENGAAALREILSRPEFQWREEPPNFLETLWQRLREWISGVIGEREWAINLDINSIIHVLTFVVIVAALAYVITSMFSDFISQSALETGAPRETPLNARQALHEADSLSLAGDYRAAMRNLYLSALLLLDERGLLYYDRAQTNREYLRQVAANQQVAGLLREVIGVFDRTWYGLQPLDKETYQHYAARVRELENLR